LRTSTACAIFADMNTAQQKYKRDTGNCYYKSIESRLMVDMLDTRLFDGWTYDEIIKAVDDEESTWAISIGELPIEYQGYGDAYIPTPEYIKWLEEQIV